MNFFPQKRSVSADSKNPVILQLYLLHSEVAGGFLGYGETIVEIYAIKVGEITLLNSHLDKWNSGAKCHILTLTEITF